MQVERLKVLPQGKTLSSGERVSNTWVIYPEDWDNLSKDGLIPNKTTISSEVEVKDGDRKACHLWRSPRPIS